MRLHQLGLFIAAVALAASTSLVQAQHRGHGNGHGNNKEWRGHGNNREWRGHRNNKEWKHYDKNYGKRYAKFGGNHDNRWQNRRVYWARPHRYAYRHHVYFPDYHMFYDPYRNGYVYQSRGRWIYSQNIPSFYAGVNFGDARIEVLKSLPIRRRPDYSYYTRRYPRNPRVNINVSF